MSLYLDVIIKNYFNFNGRARRKEFWSYFVVHVLVILFCYFIHNNILYLYLILTLCPTLGVGIRRLHDTGRSGWWILAMNSPVFFIYYYFMLLDSDISANIYGESPKDSYMDKIMRDEEPENNNENVFNKDRDRSFSFPSFDPEKIFGNETSVQIIIIVVIILSIIISKNF